MEEGATQQGEGNESGTPTFFGNYEVLKSIGKGKFAIVYRAKKVGDEQVVALKRIAVDMMNEKAREKCLKEVRLLQSLDHPNIIRYMDSFLTDNDLVIVYEWAAAGDLKRQLRKAQERGTGFEERVIWKYFSQICNAIKHMHDKRIMHRDLKPANIFLTLDGTIKVGDLGLSRELSEHTIQAHSKVGTPLYMSPEVLKGEGYDFKSDIWSLGCLLYELAMLKSPFKSEGLNLYSLFQKISNGDYQPLPENYSEELRALTYSMISTLPEQRPEIAHVCKVAQDMRTLTAERDKASRSSRKNSAGGAGADSAGLVGREDGEGASRPSSGINSRPQTQTQERPSGDQAAGRAASRGDDGHASRPAAPLQREGSFKLERVNSAKDPIEEDRGHSAHRESKTLGWGTRGNIRDASFDQQHDEDDEATVGVGQAQFLEDQRQGFVVLGSDRENFGSKSRLPQPSRASSGGRATEEKSYFKDSGSAPAAVLEREYNREEDSPPRRQPSKIGRADMVEAPSHQDGYNSKSNDAPGASSSNPYRRSRNDTKPVANLSAVAPASSERAGSREGSAKRPSREPAATKTQSLGEKTLLATTQRAESREALRVKGKTLEEHLEPNSQAFAVMEVAYAKLLALDCPLDDPHIAAKSKQRGSRGRILPIHFACDLQIFPLVAGHDQGYVFMQFRRFALLVVWLCRKVGGSVADAVGRIDVDQDAPVTTSKQILRAVEAVCGEGATRPVELSEVLPTSLISGHGINVCNLLNFFADAALQKFTALPPRYLASAEQGADGSDETFNVADDESDVMEDEAAVDRSDDGGNFATDNRGKAVEAGEASMSLEESSSSARGAGRNLLAGSMVIGAIDPVLWKAETERVASKLVSHSAGQRTSLSSAEWADHVELLKWHAESQRPGAVGGGSSVGAGPARRSGGGGPAQAADAVLEELRRQKTEVEDSLAKLRRMELAINKLGGVPAGALAYSSLKTELDAKGKLILELQGKVAQSSAALSELHDRCDEAAEAVRAKSSGGAGIGGGDSGGHVITKLKEGIFSIKADIKNMSASIAMTSNILVAQRKEATNAHREQARAARTSRRTGSAGIAEDFDPLSD